MAIKWIADDNPICGEGSIVCREVHVPTSESHNTLSGNPVFKARLEAPWATRKTAISKLLGKPEVWPHDTIFDNVVCISAEVSNDQGAYQPADENGEVLNYSGNALIDVMYIPRTGVYRQDYSGIDVYWDDEVEPRYESKPENHTLLVWGNEADTVPTDKIPLHPDEVPSTYESGQTLIHTIEAFPHPLHTIDDLIGHVNELAYTSPVTRRTYGAGTLLFRNYTVQRSFSFISYRCPADPPPEDLDMEWSGRATNTVKCIFEHKKIGWERFRRINLETGNWGYYFIRFNKDPWNKLTPFPVVDMNIILG